MSEERQRHPRETAEGAEEAEGAPGAGQAKDDGETKNKEKV